MTPSVLIVKSENSRSTIRMAVERNVFSAISCHPGISMARGTTGLGVLGIINMAEDMFGRSMACSS